MISIKDKWALVTGGSRGIGRLAALELAKQGCNLILQARNADNCSKTAAEAEAIGVCVKTVGADLENPESVEKMLAEIDAMNVDVEIVLNNAGLQVAYRNEYLETPVSDYVTSFFVNTIAPMMICYHFLPKMSAKGFGRIVNTTSGINLDPQQAGYSASKAALDKVTRDLGSKYEGTDVIISLADPGWCRTDLGGPNAPNDPSFAIPGVITGVFVNDKKSGRLFSASDFAELEICEAAAKAETMNSVY
ncbi:MAG: SDR family oxidoreductase [Oscillospiraceae bacterium]|nr:SDR family oxidoreductase [Oscillospiraceae bacterium]